jgi:ABC-type antimicrobial peptide transport system permease subunit
MEADGRIMILGAGTMTDFLGDTLERQRLAGQLLAVLGGLALLLAMLGIYGVVSFAVSRRQHEVGIRIALGAARDSVVRLFVRDVAAVVLIGAAVGIALSIPVSRAIGQFFTGSGASPTAMAAVAGVLVLTSLAATIVPATRAARTDPTNALRQD